MKFGKDANRKEEVKASLKGFGLGELTGEDFIKNLSAGEQKLTLDNCEINNLAEKYGGRFSGFSVSELVRVGIDIYYQRYHEILEKIKTGSGGRIADELFGVTDKRLIEPMPGVLFFLSLVKGWIGEKDEKIIDEFVESYSEGNAAAVKNLKTLAGRFRKAPARLAIVTSSIFYEADIVMTEVFKLLKEEVSKFPFSENTKAFLEDKFAHYNNVYDAFLTASDSSEIRLKPHRDLYSIALHRLSVPKAKFNEVIGFEDSESGTIAIRAAGVGCCVAVPFAQTAGHDLSAAAYTCPAGLPEALVQHNLFFNE